MEAYIIDHQRCDTQIYSELLEHYKKLIGAQDKNEWRFYCHVLVTASYANNYEFGYSSVPYTVLKRTFGKDYGLVWAHLEAAGLIEVKAHDIENELCRRFKADYRSNQIYFRNNLHTINKYCNLITGKPTKAKLKNTYYDENGHKYPDLIIKELKSIKDCPFNKANVLRHIDRLEERLEEIHLIYIQQDTLENKSAYENILGKYRTDLTAARTIMLDARPFQQDIYLYDPMYKVAATGRVYESGSGLQSCSRIMKHEAWNEVPDVRNYDLKASQAYGLLQQLEDAGIDNTWLADYLDNSVAKYEYSAEAGLSVQCWKDCLYMTFMGASLSGTKKGSLYRTIALESADEKETQEKLDNYLKVIEGLRASILEWHKWLITKYISINGYWAAGRYVKNAAQMTMCTSYILKTHGKGQLKRQLAAFVLQGYEAAFIMRLTELAPNYNYQVVSNQHDGVVVTGVIPMEAIEIASERSGLKYVQLEEKPYC